MFSVERAIAEARSNFILPSPPDVLLRARAICDSDDPSLAELASLIADDVALSSAILRVINSPIYGFNRQVSDARQATMLLGLESASALVASVLIQQAFVGPSAIDFRQFWDESKRVAMAMTHIGAIIKDRIPLEDLYTTGLFHDCGIAAMSIRYQDTYLECLKDAARDRTLMLTDYEDHRYHTTHAVVGYLIANGWKLPRSICKVILCHHEVAFFDFGANTDENMMMATLKIADNIVSHLIYGQDDSHWDELKDVYFDQLNMGENDYLDFREDLSVLFAKW
ncbi:HDOD domain-containing protein [Bacterioplanes sanyensis]|nr:HDOD domain-containing protein [Bacterioplanes sanyensis]